MQILKNPILARPTGFYYLEILVFFCQSTETFGEKRALGKVGIEISSDHPMVFLFGSITMEDLYFYARQIIRDNVAGNENGFRRIIINLLYAVGPLHAVF